MNERDISALVKQVVDESKGLLQEVNRPEHAAVKSRFWNLLFTILTFIGVSIGGGIIWRGYKKIEEIADTPQKMAQFRVDVAGQYVTQAVHRSDMERCLKDNEQRYTDIQKAIQSQAMTMTRMDERVAGIGNRLDRITHTQN